MKRMFIILLAFAFVSCQIQNVEFYNKLPIKTPFNKILNKPMLKKYGIEMELFTDSNAYATGDEMELTILFKSLQDVKNNQCKLSFTGFSELLFSKYPKEQNLVLNFLEDNIEKNYRFVVDAKDIFDESFSVNVNLCCQYSYAIETTACFGKCKNKFLSLPPQRNPIVVTKVKEIVSNDIVFEITLENKGNGMPFQGIECPSIPLENRNLVTVAVETQYGTFPCGTVKVSPKGVIMCKIPNAKSEMALERVVKFHLDFSYFYSKSFNVHVVNR